MARPRIKIAGGRLIDPHNRIDAELDLYVADGRVAAVGEAPDAFTVDIEIDASELCIIPGLIDLCARLREPGEEFKATIDSECRAAAAAGITTLCCPPDTSPIIDTPAVIELIHHRARQVGAARVVVGECSAILLGRTRPTLARAGLLGWAAQPTLPQFPALCGRAE